jgi:glycosyltransferase involved in cell wall biosynthesis
VSDVDRLLTAADVFVLPSSREGLSFALLEAMARGVAPVVSDGAGNEEAVGGAGIVFPLGNVEALAEALARLAGDTEERARLGEAARQRVGEHYSVERLVRTVAELYDRALGVHSGPTGPARADADAPA